MITTIVTLLVSLAFIFVLFKIGQKQEPYIFYMVLYAHLIIPAILILIFAPAIITTLSLKLSSFFIWFIILFITERIAWGISLNEVAGNEELGWFYLIYLIPLGWIIYRVSLLKG